jgi:hypothetical protein
MLAFQDFSEFRISLNSPCFDLFFSLSGFFVKLEKLKGKKAKHRTNPASTFGAGQ